MATYKVEPYVVAADVYTAAGHVGRGGWTWYTGSASWLYRIALETLLGFTKRGDTLSITPCLPRGWPGYGLEYRHGRTSYRVAVELTGAAEGSSVTLDGQPVEGSCVPLVDDGAAHALLVRTTHAPAAVPLAHGAT